MPGEKKKESQNKHMVQKFGCSSRNVPGSSQIILINLILGTTTCLNFHLNQSNFSLIGYFS